MKVYVGMWRYMEYIGKNLLPSPPPKLIGIQQYQERLVYNNIRNPWLPNFGNSGISNIGNMASYTYVETYVHGPVNRAPINGTWR